MHHIFMYIHILYFNFYKYMYLEPKWRDWKRPFFFWFQLNINIGSMYGIFTYMYHKKDQPFVDPMG